ncbi:MAG: RagB/SusD family nutrient uptake outer membrane protein [Paludibacter sp.]
MKKIKYSIMLLAVIILNACNDATFLQTERAPEFGWNNLSELQYAAVTPYRYMFYGGYGAMHSIIVTNQVMMSDCFRFLGNAEDYSTSQIYNRQMDLRVPEIESLYTKLYTVIGLTNNGLTFIQNKNDNPFKTSNSDELNEVKRIKGELYFMRAYAYYQLATIFCPPYGYADNNDKRILVKRDSVVYSGGDALKNAPVPTSEIYDLMVSDLKQAKALLPADWSTGMNDSYKDRSRANKWAASALLAQVYFTMQKFTGTESALTELDDVINNGGYTLTDNPFTNFNNNAASLLKSDAGNSEVLLWAFFADPRLLTEKTNTGLMHEALRYTHFNKCGRDARNGGNGNTSSGTSPKWSNFQLWLQMTLSKNTLIDMGWMNADGSEPVTATYDKRYWNENGHVAGYRNDYGLFFRYEGAYKDTTEYRIAIGIKQLGRRTSASDDGKYIISTKFGGWIDSTKTKQRIDKTEPVVLVNKYYRSTDGRLQNIPVIRLAELYLTRAMIKKRAGLGGQASDYNMVARRAWNSTLGGAYIDKSDAEVTENLILTERRKELAGEDAWYLAFCEALGYTIGQGDRPESSSNLTPPYSTAYWKNCIPLSELDFQKK